MNIWTQIKQEYNSLNESRKGLARSGFWLLLGFLLLHIWVGLVFGVVSILLPLSLCCILWGLAEGVLSRK
jgi:heme/copper-type cytochrome/quinol oxidase subunit 3